MTPFNSASSTQPGGTLSERIYPAAVRVDERDLIYAPRPVVVTPPSENARIVTQKVLMDYLEITGIDDHKDKVDRLYKSAVRRLEERYELALLEQTLRASYRGCGDAVLPRRPAISLTTVEVISSAGVLAAQTLSNYYIDVSGPRPIVRKTSGAAAHDGDGQLRITYVAGFGGGAGDVPDDIHEAIMKTVSDSFEMRNSRFVGSVVTGLLPGAVEEIMEPYNLL